MKMHRRAFAVLAAGFSLAGGIARAAGKTVEVSMQQAPKGLFVPDIINISVGDTVNWTNPGVITHSVTFDPAQAATKENVVLPAGVAAFDSGNMEEGATFSHSFTVKGTYKYVCKFHEAMGMTGTVVVS